MKKSLRRMLDSLRKDPSKGLEYNLILDTHKVSDRIYNIDVARSPQIAKSLAHYVNVLGKARHVNFEANLLNQKIRRFKGRA